MTKRRGGKTCLAGGRRHSRLCPASLSPSTVGSRIRTTRDLSVLHRVSCTFDTGCAYLLGSFYHGRAVLDDVPQMLVRPRKRHRKVSDAPRYVDYDAAFWQ